MEIALGVGLMVSTTILMISNDWRRSVAGLVMQFLFVAGFLALETVPALAAVKAVVGLVVASLFFLSARSSNLTHDESTPSQREQDYGLAARVTYRLVVLGLGLAIGIGMATGYPLKGLGFVTNFSVYWLAGTGLFSLMITRDLLRIGYSLLTISSAIDILGSTLVETGSLIAYSLNSILSVVIAFSIMYLATLRHEIKESAEQRRAL